MLKTIITENIEEITITINMRKDITTKTIITENIEEITITINILKDITTKIIIINIRKET